MRALAPEAFSCPSFNELSPTPELLSAAQLLRAGGFLFQCGLNIVPDLRAGIVNGQQQLGLLRNVLQIAHQRAAILAGLQVFLRVQIFTRLEQAGQLVLKNGAIDGGPVRCFPDITHRTASFLWPDFKRSRSFIRALCNCDLLFPMEHSSIPEISLCSYPSTSCNTNTSR